MDMSPNDSSVYGTLAAKARLTESPPI